MRERNRALRRTAAVLLAAAAWCGGRGERAAVASGGVRVEASAEAMGATFSVVLYGPHRAPLEAAAAAALDEAERVDRLLSNYRDASEWSAVNRTAAHRPVRVSVELFALLSACREYSRRSAGAFDITVGPLVRAWGFYRGEGSVPDDATLAVARAGVGYRFVRLDPVDRTVIFDHPGVELDPGGIGKGYAVDRMVDVLRRRRVGAALVSASGSSIYGLGSPPEDARGWRITVRGPRAAEDEAAVVFLRDLSLSTSGGGERFFRAGGRTFPHVIDPRTGYPARGAASVSIVAPRAIDSEAWTKPAFINSPRWIAAHLPAGFRAFRCDDAPAGRCRWISPPARAPKG